MALLLFVYPCNSGLLTRLVGQSAGPLSGMCITIKIEFHSIHYYILKFYSIGFYSTIKLNA